ncbi:MAG: DUF6935 domain-containing protein [Anaerolineae bacterium]
MVKIEIAALPTNLEELLVLQSSLAATPEGAAAVLVAVLLAYVALDPFAEQYLALVVDPGQLQGEALRATDRQRLKLQLISKERTIHSLVQGATPENGYQLPDPPYHLSFSRNPYSGKDESGRVKVYIACSGASTARPVSLRRSADGLWRAWEYSTLLVGVAAAKG